MELVLTSQSYLLTLFLTLFRDLSGFDARKTTGEKCYWGISRVLHFRFSFKHDFWVALGEPVPKPSRNLKSGENFAKYSEGGLLAVKLRSTLESREQPNILFS